MTSGRCTTAECERATVARGLCSMHWQRARRRGEFTASRTKIYPGAHPGLLLGDGRWAGDITPRPGLERVAAAILSRLEPNAMGCWVWTGPLRQGYGNYGAGHGRGVSGLAHRALFAALVTEPNPDLELDHLCRLRACCNPDHLEEVRSRENTIIRGLAGAALRARQTHCLRGHEFTPANTWVSPKGQRFCRACNVIRQRATTARRLARVAAGVVAAG